MRRVTWDLIAADLAAALDVCREADLDDEVAKSRFTTFHAKIIELSEARNRGGEEEARAAFESDGLLALTALAEGAEMGDIGHFVREYRDLDVLRSRLKKILQGPLLPNEEDQNSNEGRNILFELNLASKLWRAGLSPTVAEHPDVAVEVDGRRFLIECKRPLSRSGATQNVARARRQLLKQLRNAPPGSRGVIALSGTRLVKAADQILVYRGEEEGRERLGNVLERLADSFDAWRRLPDKIVGVIFHVVTPALDRETNLHVMAQQTNVHGLAKPGSPADQLLYRLYEKLAAIWY